MAPNKILEFFFYFCEICHGNFDTNCTESIDRRLLGSRDILMILILLIQVHSIFFCLFVSSISSIKVLSFLVYRSFMSLFKFIPKYFYCL